MIMKFGRMKLIADNAKKRNERAADGRRVSREIENYTMGPRMENLWRGRQGGIIRGRWGKGTKRWAENTEWTAMAKGFNRPLYSSPNGSSIKDGYKFKTWWQSRGASRFISSYRLENEVDHVKYLEYGIGTRKIIRAKKGHPFKIPTGPSSFIYRWWYRQGRRKARKITAFYPGDINRILYWSTKTALDVRSRGVSCDYVT